VYSERARDGKRHRAHLETVANLVGFSIIWFRDHGSGERLWRKLEALPWRPYPRGQLGIVAWHIWQHIFGVKISPRCYRPRLSAALFRLRLLPKLQEHRFSAAFSTSIERKVLCIEKAFPDKLVQDSELRCVALKVQPLLSLFV